MTRVDKFKFYDLVIYAARSSNGARRLSTSLGCRRWRDDLPERYTRRRPHFRGNPAPLVVNWGSTAHPHWLGDSRLRLQPVFINHGDRVKEAIDKLAFFRKASGINEVPLLKWREGRDKAAAWVAKGRAVIARTKLGGSSGEGIVLIEKPEDMIDAPLYTKYYPKTHEFRVHVFNGKVIDFTQKRFKGGAEARAGAGDLTIVRSHDNGWVHTHSDIVLAESERQDIGGACIKLLAGLGLHFGAVDCMAILYPPDADSKRRLKSFVICEVNTGPGLENSKTIEAYTNAILSLKNGEPLVGVAT